MLLNSGDECVVSWTRKRTPSVWDSSWWIGAFLESDDVSQTVPVKYHVLHHRDASGEVSVPPGEDTIQGADIRAV